MSEVKMDKKLNQNLMDWVAGDNTGLSSVTIWSALMDCQPSRPSIPYDEADFRRCWMLLRLCDNDTKKMALEEVAKRHDIWKPVVKEWDNLEQLFITGKHEALSLALRSIRPISDA